jgi:site-specific recombinase XerD
MSTTANTTPVLKNQWGSVKPYTRHKAPKADGSGGCETPDVDTCSCPKWLYVRKGSERKRYTLNTPSWAEAMAKATDRLRELDPEIAASREATAKQELGRKTVYEAINLWIDRTRTSFGTDSQIVKQYRSTFGWVDTDGVRHGGLLRYASYKQIEYIDEFTTLVCQQWLDGDQFPAKKASSKKQCWGTVRSFFNFLVERGVLAKSPVAVIKAPAESDTFAHAPYTDKQYKAMLKAVDSCTAVKQVKGEDERMFYRERVGAFLELLRWSGMDLIDAVQFRADQIENTNVDGLVVPVMRYRRTKTQRKGSIEAVIPLAKDVAQKLRDVPSCTRCVPGMPFRYLNNIIKGDVHIWSRRIKQIIHAAAVKAVPLTCRDGRPALDKFGAPVTKAPDCKMFRHTFAVGELVHGVPEEVVARMLGHVDTDMIRKHYAPWCKQRDEAHIRAVLASR